MLYIAMETMPLKIACSWRHQINPCIPDTYIWTLLRLSYIASTNAPMLNMHLPFYTSPSSWLRILKVHGLHLHFSMHFGSPIPHMLQPARRIWSPLRGTTLWQCWFAHNHY
jgi:hypothetical protein